MNGPQGAPLAVAIGGRTGWLPVLVEEASQEAVVATAAQAAPEETIQAEAGAVGTDSAPADVKVADVASSTQTATQAAEMACWIDSG